MRYCLTIVVMTLVTLSGVAGLDDATAGGPSKGSLSGVIPGANPGAVSGFVSGASSGAITGELGQVPITGAVPGTTSPGYPGATIAAAPAVSTSLEITPNAALPESPPRQAGWSVVPSSVTLNASIPAPVVVVPIVVPKLISPLPPAPVGAPR